MTEDQKKIIELLCGITVSTKLEVPKQQYFKQGAPEELDARRALVRALRSSRPLALSLRVLIADLIDPDRDEVTRIIRFQSRRKGKPSSALAEKKIANFIWSRVRAGCKTESAFKEAEIFGLKRSRILEIWSHWKPILERTKRKI